jgi:hypothetical protein
MDPVFETFWTFKSETVDSVQNTGYVCRVLSSPETPQPTWAVTLNIHMHDMLQFPLTVVKPSDM